jgi:site-specific DNA-cytosine methylase
MTLKMLDCFCGMGGVSDGFAKEGFDVTGIDIENAPSLLGYKHKFIQGDIHNLNGVNFKEFSVIWGSPPCRNFSAYAKLGACGWGPNRDKGKWKIPPNPEEGLRTVKQFLNFVEQAQPKIWIMENVNGLAEYFKDLKPRAIGAKIKGGKRHVFYGNYPTILIPQASSISMNDVSGKLRSWERAKIPLSCSQAFARVCREALEVEVIT